jgi:hypothetical protein
VGTGVAGYQVWKDGSPLATTTSLSYTVIGLTAGTEYTFHVSAYDAQGNMSALSDSVTATTADNGNVAPVWQTVPQQELTTGLHYSLPLGTYVGDTDGPGAVTVAQVSGTLPTGVTYNSTTKVVSGTPTAASTPTVVFRASDGSDTTDVSVVFNCLNADTTAPSVPTNLTATPFNSTRIDLAWTASSDTTVAGARTAGLAGYKVYRDGVLRTTTTAATYSDTGLAAATTYSYRVSAIDAAAPANESAQCTAVVGTTQSNLDPQWTDDELNDNTVTPNQAFSYEFEATDVEGDPISFSYTLDSGLEVTVGAESGGTPNVRTITVYSTAGIAPGASVSATLDFTDTGSAEADWADRSTAAGVVWAHRFNDQKTANFCDTPNDSTHGTVSILTTGGIIGDGCLRLNTPAGKFPGMRWARPLAPMVASSSMGYDADINNAGLATIAPHTWYATTNVLRSRLANGRGGFFGHASYYDPTYKPMPYPAAPTIAAPEFVHAGAFWIQYRMKVSASRFASGEVSGKVMMLEALAGSSNSVEYVQGLLANNAFLPDGMYHYTDVGNQGFDAGENVWLPETWYTVMYKITPGQSGVANAGVQLKVAAYGATSWTTLLDRTDILWNYSEGFDDVYPPANQTEPIPYGWNLFMLSTFNGGDPQINSVNGYTTDYDQVICSTQEIALPEY